MTKGGEDFARLGSLLPGAGAKGAMPAERRIALVWADVVGPEVARNAQPRTLRNGRLVVATSSSVWAQTLQHMATDILGRLNEALAEFGVPLVREAVFRPAGWDPGGGPGAPAPLDVTAGAVYAGARSGPGPSPEATAGSTSRSPQTRRLTSAEEEAVSAVRRGAPDPELGERMARAMRAALERLPGTVEE